MANLRGYLTTQDAAKKLGVTRAYIYHLIDQGRLEAIRVGARMLLVRSESIRNFRRSPRGRPKKKEAKE